MSQQDQTETNVPEDGDMDLPAGMFRGGEVVKDITFNLFPGRDGDEKELKGKYSEIDEMGFFEGDIALGTLEEIEAENLAADDRGIAISDKKFRWGKDGATQLTIPYTTVPELEPTVKAALAHWESKTPIRFVKRTSEQDYFAFEKQNGCWSFVGKRGGKQTISLGAGCSIGSAIHEIGHTLGLWHEQSRSDRDNHVKIVAENIMSSQKHNFDKHILDGTDLGRYDFGSIMHYPANAFSKNGLPTIIAKDGQPIGQRNGLSAGDIEAIKLIYPKLNWPKTGISADSSADAVSNDMR